MLRAEPREEPSGNDDGDKENVTMATDRQLSYTLGLIESRKEDDDVEMPAIESSEAVESTSETAKEDKDTPPNADAAPSEPSTAPKKYKKAPSKTLKVLQKDITEQNLDFTEDGLNVLSRDVENGSRRGFKLEVKTWRWAGMDIIGESS